MLVEFSVANFRCIRDRQTLSMVATSRRSGYAERSFETGVKSVPRLLGSAAIYGPNASGKSTLVMALGFVDDFVNESAKSFQEGEKIDVTPFLLSKQSEGSPSEFEIVFIENGNRYQYGFSVTRERVWEEWMFVVPKGGRSQRWLVRSYDADTKEYNWYINPTLKGEREVWRKSTRDNALFLSSAIQLRAQPLREAFDWFRKKLRVIRSSQRLLPSYSGALCLERDKKDKILQFLQSTDLHISDVSVSEREFSVEHLPKEMSDEMKKTIKDQLSGEKVLYVRTVHKDDTGDNIYFDFEEESDGARVIFSLAGPWLDVLENGRVLIVDELHNSLHPLVVRSLVGVFQNSEINKSNAQLIFTSHDTSLMTAGFLQRDQIWLLDKDEDQASFLIPLSDFKPRPNEAFQRGYLGGRYGGVPYIPKSLIS